MILVDARTNSNFSHGDVNLDRFQPKILERQALWFLAMDVLIRTRVHHDPRERASTERRQKQNTTDHAPRGLFQLPSPVPKCARLRNFKKT